MLTSTPHPGVISSYISPNRACKRGLKEPCFPAKKVALSYLNTVKKNIAQWHLLDQSQVHIWWHQDIRMGRFSYMNDTKFGNFPRINLPSRHLEEARDDDGNKPRASSEWDYGCEVLEARGINNHDISAQILLLFILLILLVSIFWLHILDQILIHHGYSDNEGG